MRSRLPYIDNAKCLGIFLVVLGHMPLRNIFLNDWIFTFHIPLFFFISGFLSSHTSEYKLYMKKNLYSLILVTVPYFIISLLCHSLQNYYFYPEHFNLENILLKPLNYYLTGDSRMGPMWFLIALFWMRIFYNYLSGLFTSRILFWSAIIFSIIVYYTSFRCNIYQISATIFAFPFYCLGHYCRVYNWVDRYAQISSFYRMGFTFVLVLLSIVCTLFCGEINLNALELGHNIFCYYFTSFIGIAMAFSFSLFFKGNEKIAIISQGTLLILGLHMWLIQAYKLAYKQVLNITTPPPYMDSLSAILGAFGIVYFLSFLIKKVLQSRYKLICLLAGKR